MAEIDRERLAEVMEMAAAGVETAPIALYQEFGLHIARALRRHLAALGVRDVAADDLHGLTMDACFELATHARAWNPAGGALPWVWAERRLRQVASGYVGQWSDAFDERIHDRAGESTAEPPAAPGDPDELDLLRSLAARRPDVDTYAGALAAAATSERNQRVLLAYRLQASLGDPSPANTVGARFGMKPATVRQVVKRTGDRLAQLWQPETVAA
jgi:hypothetical protein